MSTVVLATGLAFPEGPIVAADGAIWVSELKGGGVARIDTNGRIDRLPTGGEPNGLAFAPDGSLVFSCPGDSRRGPTGYLCRLRLDGAVERVAGGLLFPNGVCFSPDGERLFVAETYGRRVVSGTWTDDGPLALGPLFDTPGPIGADGVAAIGMGSVATCVHGAGLVRVHDRATGAIRDVAVPDARPAGCAADPVGRWPLIVTGTEQGVVLGVSL